MNTLTQSEKEEIYEACYNRQIESEIYGSTDGKFTVPDRWNADECRVEGREPGGWCDDIPCTLQQLQDRMGYGKEG